MLPSPRVCSERENERVIEAAKYRNICVIISWRRAVVIG